MILCTLRWLAVLVLTSISASALAQNAAAVGVDPNFGSNGFAPIPVVAGAAPSIVPVGFVHLPQSGNYLMFSMQNFSGTPRIVSSKLLENGAVDMSYGSSGSLVYALPLPDPGLEFRVVAAVHGGAEIVYLVYKFSNGRLGVVRLAGNGALIDFASSDFPILLGEGIGSIRDVAATFNLASTFPGLLIVVQGNGSDVEKAVLAQYWNGAIHESSSHPVTDFDLRINRILERADGKFDVVGTAGGLALYNVYDADNNALGFNRYFNLTCSSGGLAMRAVLDDIVRDAPLGSEPMLLGRAQCDASGNGEVVAARVSQIETAATLTQRLTLASELGECGAVTTYCLPAMATMSHAQPGRLFVSTANLELAFVDVVQGTGALKLVDRFSIETEIAGQAHRVFSTHRYGSHQDYPWLTGVAVRLADLSFGLGRVSLSSLLSDGFE